MNLRLVRRAALLLALSPAVASAAEVRVGAGVRDEVTSGSSGGKPESQASAGALGGTAGQGREPEPQQLCAGLKDPETERRCREKVAE